MKMKRPAYLTLFMCFTAFVIIEGGVSNTSAKSYLHCPNVESPYFFKSSCEACCGSCDTRIYCCKLEAKQIDDETCKNYNKINNIPIIVFIIVMILFIGFGLVCYLDYRMSKEERKQSIIDTFLSMINIQQLQQQQQQMGMVPNTYSGTNFNIQQGQDPPPSYQEVEKTISAHSNINISPIEVNNPAEPVAETHQDPSPPPPQQQDQDPQQFVQTETQSELQPPAHDKRKSKIKRSSKLSVNNK